MGLWRAWLVPLALLAVGCGGQTVADDGGLDAQAPTDAATSGDVVASDGAPAVDASVDVAPPPPPPTYNDVTDTSKWEAFDLNQWLGGAGLDFVTASVDAHYVYFASLSVSTPTIVRYDRAKSFTDAASWSKFDPSQVSSTARGFFGSAIVGSAVYLVPWALDASTFSSFVYSFQTTAGFDNPAAYSVFDLTMIAPADTTLVAYNGSTFDGRYLYLGPGQNQPSHFKPVRYDTTAPFTSASSWQKFDLGTVKGIQTTDNFFGAAFDGRYVYYGPDYTHAYLRYDTQASFTAASAWEVTRRIFGLSNLEPLRSFGMVFDGRYIYYVPLTDSDNTTYYWGGVVIQYDTHGPFTSNSSWATMQASSVGYCGGVFDGRYVYFLPCGFAYDSQGYDGLSRYDTTGPFTSPGSWSSIDLQQIPNTNVAYGSKYYGHGWMGGAFDGEYVYLTSCDAPALRFKAKTPPSEPPTYTGSFL